MARRVQQAHPNGADLDDIVVPMRDQRRHERAAHLRYPRNLVLLDVDRDLGQLQQVHQSLYVLPKNVPTHMVCVVVSRQYPREREAGLFDPSDQRPYVISRVHQQYFARSGVAYDVDVVPHCRCELVAGGEVPPREELAEEQPFWHRPIVQTARTSSPGQSPKPYLVRMTDELCLLCVHAHPDDESSKGASTVAKYHAEGVRSVLVCCTGGEEGEILNPAMNRPEILEHLPEVRAAELARAAAIIGYDELVMLGYRDSGMPGTEANERPESFFRSSIEQATARHVAVVRRTKPQVMAIYPAHQSLYPHPDHIRAHEVGFAAFHAAGDPDAFPEAGPAWQPQKLYYMLWSKKRMFALAEKFTEMGLEFPWGEERLEMMADAPQEDITTEIDVAGFGHVRDEALRAHATQVDPKSPFWFGLPPEVAEELGHYDEYHLAENFTGSQPPEDDLFAGVRERATL